MGEATRPRAGAMTISPAGSSSSLWIACCSTGALGPSSVDRLPWFPPGSQPLRNRANPSLDIASHIVSDRRLGEPHTNQELFALLQQDHWLSPELTATMHKMVGFRNIVVHGYQSVDPRIMRDIVEHRLDDLLAFTTAITSPLAA
jgi:hypothetical protein